VSVPKIVAVMAVGYLLVMGVLALGLRRAAAPERRRPRPRLRGWPGLIREVVATMLGGYLLLMAVVFAYYYGVARVGSSFLINAVTGSAMLMGLALPLYLAASWLVERRRRHGRPKPLGAPRGGC
jgi:drug/metabolite transporter (DMT)-like permease